LRKTTKEIEALLAKSEKAEKRVREAEEEDRHLKEAIRLERAKVPKTLFFN
jgi:hypothetical protein